MTHLTLTARQRLTTYASLSRLQSDEDTYDMRLPNITDDDIGGLMPCPACPDGYAWNANGPTAKCCPTCNGHAVVHLDGRPVATELGLPIELQP